METPRFISLPPRGPIVSFDTRLGEKIPKGRVLDFSERQFRMLCERAEPSIPGAADHAQIVVTPNKIRGSYDSETKVIEVEYDGSLRQANSAARHETSHFLEDYKNGQTSHTYYRLTKALYRIGFWTVSGALLAGAVCADVYIINDIQNTKPPEYLYPLSRAVGAIGVGGIFMRLSYRLHPEELRADYVSSKYAHLKPLSLRYASEY